MTKRILVVYRWATLGGVERILLNRARAFARASSDVQLDVYFIEDAGGVDHFSSAIRDAKLQRWIRVVPSCNGEKYDLVVSVDTPEILELVRVDQKVAFECHTAYVENRRYLNKVRQRATAIAAPSPAFVDEIRVEYGDFEGRLCLVRNFVCVPETISAVRLPQWAMCPVVHLGRMDALKNVTELLDGVRLFRKRYGDRLNVVLVGPASDEVDVAREVGLRDLSDRTIVLPAIGFGMTCSLLAGLAERQAIFTSCSKAESFGLSAAEAIAMGLPVLLSNLAAHRELVAGKSEHLYRLGDVSDWVDKLAGLMRERAVVSKLDNGFDEHNFLSDWASFVRQASA
jgi:glycosyltransferase involved in cell wall biosynthesis